MNNLDQQYQSLLQDILDNGVEKKDRTGTGTISVFGRQIRHKMSDGFPLLTTKKMAWKQIVTELLWFLRGDTNIKYLVENDCNIWTGDCYQNYDKQVSTKINILIGAEFVNKGWVKPTTSGRYAKLSKEEFINKIKTDDEFAKKWGDLGSIYGKQWRKWKIRTRHLRWNQLNELQQQDVLKNYSKEDLDRTHPDVPFYEDEIYIDQITNLINDLKTNPDSRRLMVSAWNVGELEQCVLPPCHYGFQVYTRELSVNERLSYYCNLIGVYKNPGFELGKSDEYYDSWLENHNVPKRAISLMWNQRSVDTFLGLPFNIASYGLLLEILAKEVNMVPDELIGNLGDTHLYTNHIEQAKEQIGRTSYELPTLKIEDEVKWEEGGCLPYYSPSNFIIENYQSHPAIKAPLSN